MRHRTAHSDVTFTFNSEIAPFSRLARDPPHRISVTQRRRTEASARECGSGDGVAADSAAARRRRWNIFYPRGAAAAGDPDSAEETQYACPTKPSQLRIRTERRHRSRQRGDNWGAPTHPMKNNSFKFALLAATTAAALAFAGCNTGTRGNSSSGIGTTGSSSTSGMSGSGSASDSVGTSGSSSGTGSAGSGSTTSGGTTGSTSGSGSTGGGTGR